jgi:NAD(P)H-dependent FMN reductase
MSAMELVISCSLHPQSRSRTMARRMHKGLVDRGSEAAFVDLREFALPICDGDRAGEAEAVIRLTDLVASAGGIILATPIYNFDVSAAAKNMVELAGSAWTGKLVGFICASGGTRSYMSVLGLANSLLLDFHCHIFPRFVFAASDSFDDDGQLADPNVLERIDHIADRFHRLSEMLARFA